MLSDMDKCWYVYFVCRNILVCLRIAQFRLGCRHFTQGSHSKNSLFFFARFVVNPVENPVVNPVVVS